ncbi:MAG TPA: 16S rRNA (cytosine(1402)-N(4))-methyltransferase RsmH [Bacillota bacterium]|nr:16S rRNA (cytosine(1402)-N(4))-methyltransferase RsmH [Bacillota bacterium]
MEYVHQPVMLNEVLEGLDLKPGGVYVDCTVGGAGHSEAILRRIAPGGCLVAIDRDGEAIAAAGKKLAGFGDRVRLVRENYVNLHKVLESLGIKEVDGILFDLGVSSYQLENPGRGFSYHTDSPLDMRMNREQKITARDLVNALPAGELARIIRDYGEERWASRIAEFIAAERERRPVETTGQLVEIIKKAVPAGARRKGPHPARRTFQALRIAVNRELEDLQPAVASAVRLLRSGGRICVITFHSLEDRIVKNLFRRLASPCECTGKIPACVCGGKREIRIITPKPLAPAEPELKTNPRSRSAKLRIAEKL